MPFEIAKAKPALSLESSPGASAYLAIRDLIYRTSGIYHPDEGLFVLITHCMHRMAALGASSPLEYLVHLTTRPNRAAELRLLLNEITVSETYLFRYPAQLDALRNVILPQILQIKGFVGPKCLRFWCAGCSTGKEPHTLAMFLLEEKERLLSGWTWDILATDLNDNSLETAGAGIYAEHALRATSDGMRRKYFKDVGDKKLQANDLLRAQIRFDRVNLSDDSQMLFQKRVDVIFCRNVLIYFDPASKRRVVQHFYSNLLPGGFLFLGCDESLFHEDDSFRLVHFSGATAYWKPAAAQAVGGRQ